MHAALTRIAAEEGTRLPRTAPVPPAEHLAALMNTAAPLAATLATDRATPESIMPEQFFDPSGSALSSMPERRLMFAILLDAVLQLQRRGSTGAAEALRWLQSSEDWPCSFARVCDALGIEPVRLSRGLLEWYASGKPHLLGAPARRLRTRRLRITPRHRRRRRQTGGVARLALPVALTVR